MGLGFRFLFKMGEKKKCLCAGGNDPMEGGGDWRESRKERTAGGGGAGGATRVSSQREMGARAEQRAARVCARGRKEPGK